MSIGRCVCCWFLRDKPSAAPRFCRWLAPSAGCDRTKPCSYATSTPYVDVLSRRPLGARLSHSCRGPRSSDLVRRDGSLLPSQLRRSEHDDPIPQEHEDRGWTAPNRAFRSRRGKPRQSQESPDEIGRRRASAARISALRRSVSPTSAPSAGPKCPRERSNPGPSANSAPVIRMVN